MVCCGIPPCLVIEAILELGCLPCYKTCLFLCWDSLTALSGDTRHVLTGSADNSCRLWDCETGRTSLRRPLGRGAASAVPESRFP